ncbi:ChrR family anti-sigma-E factor [Reyranella sp.]|uniref:ChrR family anti-sigma-E factor n=1 Tax=Reyranella sp. TaxID=1929291 RepID=UPI003BABFC02
MSRHPAPDELLLDYAAGALPDGPALAVALHVALDPRSQRTVDRLNAVGGALIDREPVPDVGGAQDAAALEQALARLDEVPVEPRPGPADRRHPAFGWAPAPLVPHLRPGMDWRRVMGKFDEIRLDMPGDFHRVSLLRLESGRGLPEHKHAGYEYTVVLQGGYTDETGNYGVGDFAVGPGGQRHEPIADPGEPCIALIVVENPIVLTGPWGRWLNPLVSRGWI